MEAIPETQQREKIPQLLKRLSAQWDSYDIGVARWLIGLSYMKLPEALCQLSEETVRHLQLVVASFRPEIWEMICALRYENAVVVAKQCGVSSYMVRKRFKSAKAIAWRRWSLLQRGWPCDQINLIEQILRRLSGLEGKVYWHIRLMRTRPMTLAIRSGMSERRILEAFESAIERGELSYAYNEEKGLFEKAERPAPILPKIRRKARRLYLKQDEITLGELGRRCGVKRTMPLEWKDKGYVKCERRGHWWVIKRSNYLSFLKAAATYKIPVQKRVSASCQRLLERERRRSPRLDKILCALGDDSLSSSDWVFAYYHVDGCSLNELCTLLKEDISPAKLRYASQTGKTGATKLDNGFYRFELQAMITNIVLARDWTPTNTAAREAEERDHTVLDYARDSELGETRTYITGELAIRKSVASNLSALCEEIRRKRRANCNTAETYLRPGEYSPRTFAEAIGATDSAVKFFEKKKHYIKSETRDGRRIYTHDELVRFAVAVSSGEIVIRSIKIRQRCQRIADTS